MQRKYYRYDDTGPCAPSSGVPMHAQNGARRQNSRTNGEIITPQPVQEHKSRPEQEKQNGPTALLDGVFKDGKLLGRFETDDIILLCLIVLLVQNSEELDWPLLIALGYIFLSDKDFKLF